MSQEECASLREGVLYVKVYRYNPKHLCPKLNGYGDNGQRKVWSSCGSTHCTCQLKSYPFPSLSLVSYDGNSAHASHRTARVLPSAMLRRRWAFSCIVLGTLRTSRDMSASVFVVQFNGFTSLTSSFDVKYRY